MFDLGVFNNDGLVLEGRAETGDQETGGYVEVIASLVAALDGWEGRVLGDCSCHYCLVPGEGLALLQGWFRNVPEYFLFNVSRGSYLACTVVYLRVSRYNNVVVDPEALDHSFLNVFQSEESLSFNRLLQSRTCSVSSMSAVPD